MPTEPPPPAPRSNQPWADGLVEELVRLGVDRFVVAPGSRSTPLAVAVARHPRAHPVVHFDERGGAFYALGYARAAGRPAAWITTSGTAVANGLPAVVEADADGVPLLLLTADRPPELRATGANQTIVQPGLFGGYVRWAADVPVPDPAVDPAYVLTTAGQAVHRATSAPAGPVHLNLMFREPLAPGGAPPFGADAPHLAAWRAGDRPYTTYGGGCGGADAASAVAVAAALAPVRRGLVVAGRLRTEEEGRAARRLAGALGWPLLPDVLSGLRLGGAKDDLLVRHYDALLQSSLWADAHAPEAVVHFGRPAVSKRLAGFLARVRPAVQVVVDPSPHRLDPAHGVTHRVQADVAAFAEALAARVAPRPDAAFVDAWRTAEARVAGAFDEAFAPRGAQGGVLSEPLVARIVTQALPGGHGLFVAASMPVRDVDAFGRASGAPVRVAANRGASGIDGTVAAAAGFADGLGTPAVLLVGDLALLHDLNSLALLRDRRVVVVVVNNGGGGIFSFLPIAAAEDVFTLFFETPHPFGFEHAAALFGLPYARPETVDAFRAAYAGACASGGPAVLEVRTERSANRVLHDALADLARRTVDGTV